MRILLIEDDKDVAANIGDYLSGRDHAVDFAYDGPNGLRWIRVQETWRDA